MLLGRQKDLGKPIKSFDGLKYLMISWTIIGTKPLATTMSKHWRVLYYLYSAVINFLVGICFPATIWANLWFIDTWQEIVANLSLNVTVSMALCKQLPVLLNRYRILDSMEYLKALDERSNHHLQDRRKILDATYRCRLICLIYLSTYFLWCCASAYIGWSNRQLVYSARIIRLFASAEANYVAALLFQCMSQYYLVFQNGFNDFYPLCFLTLMIAHLESLAARITRIGKNEINSRTTEENIEELRLCILDHKNLLGFFDCIRPIISATLFFQFIITAFVLCMTAINLIVFEHDLREQVLVLVYVAIVLMQAFPCCWHVNVLMEKSDYLTTAMYSCNWMDQNQKFRKMLIIFMQRSQKTNTILAGNLAPVTLQTYLAIIRFAFSMYTIFSQI